MKVLKKIKGPTTKQNLDKRKAKKFNFSKQMQNLFSFNLFTFVVLLFIDAIVVIVTIRLFRSKK